MSAGTLNARPTSAPPTQAVLPGVVEESRPIGSVSDAWATPPAFVVGLGLISRLPGCEAFPGFVPDLDVCAEAWSAKAPRWYGPGGARENAFEGPWDPDLEKWNNPPFSLIDPWTDEGLVTAERGGRGCTLHLVPARVDRPWYHRLDEAAERGIAWRTLVEGRVEFVPPAGVKGGNVGGGIELWQTGGRSRRLPRRLVREQVEELGRLQLRGLL